MSIPPLVCSTPPPPDQCEDDKDPEDFELSYSLSQEEDESNQYEYGNFSSFDNFQSSIDSKTLEVQKQEIIKKKDEIDSEVFMQYEDIKETEHNIPGQESIGLNDINENKLKCEEDKVSIEDLDLQLNEEIVITTEELNEEIVTNEINEQNVDSLKDLNIQSDSSNGSVDYDSSNNPPFVENSDSHSSIERKAVLDFDEAFGDLTASKVPDDVTSDTQETAGEILNSIDGPSIPDKLLVNAGNEEQQLQESPKDIFNESTIDDDFGDFDEFKSVNIENIATNVVETCDNPWENANNDESDFGDFTANFENALEVSESTSQQSEIKTLEESNKILENNEDDDVDDDEDDDFGDFDDFKSSTVVQSESKQIAVEDTCQELPVLNLQADENEHQIMESITKVISSVFLEEISKPENEFESKLETLLSETWGHLMETDERQPYIVNWNNSLGQKTLLKALCIDSRNILFGPKWSSHMPKFAANLSNAPLQPQKQASTPSNTSQNEMVAEKPSNKPTTWTDPFTSDGQDSCNTENDPSTSTPRPVDLGVFEAAISSKPEKIYSSTLAVQPLRQINLPDTHIFTPTDSEIPRSKTIHYDSGSSVIMSQPNDTESKNQDNSIPPSSLVLNTAEDDNEYWEFQDFKGSTGASSLPSSLSQSQLTSQGKIVESSTVVEALPQPSIAYQTQLLQPIKVQPTMPSLNWPDPGEVKGVFDDFSEFVSIPSQSAEQQEPSVIQPAEVPLEISNTIKSDNLNDLKEKTDEVLTQKENSGVDSFDDDFDTFQSAVPTSSATNNFNTNALPTLDHPKGQFYANQPADLNYASPTINTVKSDTISFPISRPTEALSSNTGFMSSTTEIVSKNSQSSASHLQTNMLQPTMASFTLTNTQIQQKSGQILQPLSLESYSQINWPSPGIDLQDLSRFNPVETLQSLKSDLSVSGLSKTSSPVHGHKNIGANPVPDDDVWGDFVSSKPKQQSLPKKQPVTIDDDEWTDFISSPSVKPQNGLNTISLNVHTNSNIHKTVPNKLIMKSNQTPIDIPTLNYITPKTNSHKSYNDKHFQNL